MTCPTRKTHPCHRAIDSAAAMQYGSTYACKAHPPLGSANGGEPWLGYGRKGRERSPEKEAAARTPGTGHRNLAPDRGARVRPPIWRGYQRTRLERGPEDR